jgi:D-hexose-6-phosphate mutarotase
MNAFDALRPHEIPGRVAFVAGEAGLPKAVITTGVSTCEIYLHGAHVVHFQRHGEKPLLFLSRRSGFGPGVPIRGGIPICHPWFGPREGGPGHGLARLVEWQVAGTGAAADGGVTIRLAMPALGGEWDALKTELEVTVSDVLSMRMTTTNAGMGPIPVESCLHTYFQVGDVGSVRLLGLGDAPFDDFAFGANGQSRLEPGADLRIFQETNRVYPHNAATVEIQDPSLARVIRVEKSGSRSTVVWNPWTTQKLPDDFDPDEYREMVCVESGNVKKDAVLLGPGQATTFEVTLGNRVS